MHPRQAHVIHEFGEFRLDALRRMLTSRTDGNPVALSGKSFDTLLYLVERAGELLDKPTLMSELWPTVVVEEGNLTQMIHTLRRALGATSAQNYVEVVFSPRGQTRINAVENGRRTTLAEAPYAGGGRNQWFEVEVAGNGDFSGVGGHVKVNGVTVFDPLPRSDMRGERIGFITHWVDRAKFDDVRTVPYFFRPVSATMDDGRFPSSFYSPTSNWRVQDGTINSFGVTANETAGLDVLHDISDTEFRARMVNRYGGAGNLIGLTYAYRNSEDYFEVVFSPTGVARLNRRLKGVTTNVATASYAGGGQHQWFDVQLIQRNLLTTVKVNGATVFDEIPQPDAGGVDFGLVAHWANANFDDISITEVPPAP